MTPQSALLLAYADHKDEQWTMLLYDVQKATAKLRRGGVERATAQVLGYYGTPYSANNEAKMLSSGHSMTVSSMSVSIPFTGATSATVLI